MVKQDDRFLKIYSQSNGFGSLNEIWVDKRTGVNYLFHANCNAGGLTPLLNADGSPVVTPVTWEKE